MDMIEKYELYREASELLEKHSTREASKISGIPRTTLQRRAQSFKQLEKVERDLLTRAPVSEMPLPPEGKRRAYIITSAQNDTDIHKETWKNLKAYRDYMQRMDRWSHCEIMVVPFTYRTVATKDGDPGLWRKAVVPYFVTNRVKLAPGLELCGEIQISPTANRPLSGFDNYTHDSSSIIPHTTFSVKSVPTMKHDPVKFMYTTGAITVPQYLQQKAGQKAEFHHSIGALLVEVDDEGDWFVYQLKAGDDGTCLLYTSPSPRDS